ncbi:fimbrial protein [Segatella paludivivens]|uniref:fimbrial protein n=1 Tax=Segatella paludivivens TaxID=185294 RepID=UPI00046EBA5A|nr:fimbrial protein [Segatella paludivivens]
MKGLTIKIQALLLCGVLITGLFSSCASDENIDNGNKVNAGDKVLTLTLNTPKATTTSGAKTRTTSMTANTTEDQINRLTIGIFSSDGNTVRTIQELSSGTTTGTYSTASGITTATMVTNSLQAGDIVLVAANAPTGTFKGCTKASDFTAKSIAIDVALATPAGAADLTKEAMDNIPMYGDASTSGTGNGVIVAPTGTATTYTATVKIQHQLAKITLNTLGVAFDQNGPYKAATFKPTSFFLINVPDNLNFNAAVWNGSTAQWQGFDNTTTAGKATYKEYLGTGAITTYSPLAVNASITPNTPIDIFYTIPNSDATNNTKLVIGGDFSSDGSSTTPVYYPVNINWYIILQQKHQALLRLVQMQKRFIQTKIINVILRLKRKVQIRLQIR